MVWLQTKECGVLMVKLKAEFSCYYIQDLVSFALNDVMVSWLFKVPTYSKLIMIKQLLLIISVQSSSVHEKLSFYIH